MNNQENNFNNNAASNNQNIQNNVPVNNDNNNKRKTNKKFLIIGIVVGILVVAGFIINIINQNTYYVDDEDVIEKTNNNTKLKACNIKSITISESSEAENLLEKLTGWRAIGWNYDDGSISSKQLDTYTKVSTALYSLGYFEISVRDEVGSDGCTLSKKAIDSEIEKIFNDTSYEPSEFKGSSCLLVDFEYNSINETYTIKPGEFACGSAGGFLDKIYDEKENGNTLTFKTKVLKYGIDGIFYLDTNNNPKIVVENIPDGVTSENTIDKYDNYANIFEWTFIKKNGEYVFDNIKKLK